MRSTRTTVFAISAAVIVPTMALVVAAQAASGNKGEDPDPGLLPRGSIYDLEHEVVMESSVEAGIGEEEYQDLLPGLNDALANELAEADRQDLMADLDIALAEDLGE